MPGVRGLEEGGPEDLVGVWGNGRLASGRGRERVNVAPRVNPLTGVDRLLLA